jgi:TetR/AcrR family transcriptional regulator, repressor of fatR-cypB operon
VIAVQPFYISADDPPAKQKIIVAALGLFAKDGVSATTVRDIAEASGYTNPALFKHFPSKEALAAFLFERCYLELLGLVSTVAESRMTFPKKHRALIAAYVAALDRDANAVLYVQDNLRHFWPKMSVSFRKHSILEKIRMVLSSGQNEGLVTREIELELLVTAWTGTLQQFARVRYFGEFKRPSEELVRILEKVLTRMVRK